MNKRIYFMYQGFFLPWVGLALLIVMVGAGLFVKKILNLSPGEVSGMHPNNEALGGYVSHADFEMECGHCHAPLHCITDDRCQECHMTVAQQRVEGQGLHAKLPGTERCQNCHMEHNGREASITVLAYENVDHDQLADFSLALHGVDYEGEPMDCESCHLQSGYASDSLDCISCHAQADHAYISEHIELYGTVCVPCHDGRDRMLAFDHARFYPLEHQHAEAECQECHADHVFLAEARDCVACHEDPEIHNGKFGQDCARCHTAVAWSPAYLIQHNFYLEHGSEGENECAACHLENYTDQTCYNCHEHTLENMQQVHLAEGISEYQECAQCHPTGVTGEAAMLRDKGMIMSETGDPGGQESLLTLPQSGGEQFMYQIGGPAGQPPDPKQFDDIHGLPPNGKK
jgi:hypothetical protein